MGKVLCESTMFHFGKNCALLRDRQIDTSKLPLAQPQGCVVDLDGSETSVGIREPQELQ